MYIYIYIIILSCALQSHRASGGTGLKSPTWAPSWAPSWTCTAKVGCQAALGRQFELPRRTWTPFWVPTWRPRALPECPQPLRTTLPCRRERKISKSPFVLSKCSWAAFWQLLGPAWAPFGLHLESLRRLLGSTWSLWGALGCHLGASWTPLGLHLGLLGASWANLRPSGRQMGSKWTPSGRQMDAEWTSFGRQVGLSSWTATTAANVNVRLKNATTAAMCH